MEKRTYSVLVEWGYGNKGPYERCYISPSKEDDFNFDGNNYVSKGGSEGMNFFIASTLEEAITRSRFKPSAIEFHGLTTEELKLKTFIVEKLEQIQMNENGVPQYE